VVARSRLISPTPRRSASRLLCRGNPRASSFLPAELPSLAVHPSGIEPNRISERDPVPSKRRTRRGGGRRHVGILGVRHYRRLELCSLEILAAIAGAQTNSSAAAQPRWFDVEEPPRAGSNRVNGGPVGDHGGSNRHRPIWRAVDRCGRHGGERSQAIRGNQERRRRKLGSRSSRLRFGLLPLPIWPPIGHVPASTKRRCGASTRMNSSRSGLWWGCMAGSADFQIELDKEHLDLPITRTSIAPLIERLRCDLSLVLVGVFGVERRWRAMRPRGTGDGGGPWR
jgi:hypothetical protein